MRKLGRWLAGVIVLLGVAFAVWQFGSASLPEALTRKAGTDKLALIPQAAVSIGYLVPQEKWLEYDLKPGAAGVKIVCNATIEQLEQLREQRRVDPSRRWSFALDIEVQAGDGKLILARTHHFRSDLSEFRLPDGRTYTQAFYLRDNLTPLAGTSTAIHLAGLPAASRLRVRLASKDDDIHDVLLRLYQPDAVSEQRAATAWQRMAERARESLVKSSVYPAELVLESEIRNLLRNAMEPVGPRGAQGRDYLSRELYVLFDNNGEVADAPIPPAGVPADRGLHASVPLPPAGGMFRVQLTPLTSSTVPVMPQVGAGDTALIRWHGTTAFERRELTVPLQANGPTEIRQRFAGGLLDVETPGPMAVRVWQETAATTEAAPEPMEITPPPRYARSYVSTADDPLAYVFDGQRHASVVRLDFRRQLAIPGPAQDRVRYEIVNAQGQPLRTGVIDLTLKASAYERIAGDGAAGAAVSDPVPIFFLLPGAAHRMRLWDATTPGEPQRPWLISAQSRPYELARELRIPEDRYDFDALGKRIPEWFSLQPDAWEERVRSNRTRLITTQSRPAEVMPELLSGRYQWEDIRPIGPWLTRPILTPREAGAPFRDDILPGSFSPIALDRWTRIEIPPYQGMTTVAPTLLWIGASGPVTLSVELDDRPPVSLRLAGPYAETSLGPVLSGHRRLRISGPATGRVYVNHVRPGAGTLLRRLGQRFDTKMSTQMSFDFERTQRSEETLTVRLFQPHGTSAPTRLDVRIAGPKPPELTPLTGWITPQRQAIIMPDASFSAAIFDTDGQRSDPGQPIYIPFAADSPLGRYRITVKADQGASGYLGLTRMGPETRPTRQVHLETELRHAQIID